MTFSRSKLKRKDTLERQDEEGEEEDEEERKRREEEEVKTREPQVEFRLSSTSAQPDAEVIYDFVSGHYQPVRPGDHLIHLFSAPSRIMPREEFELKQLQKARQEGVEEQDEKEVEEEIMRRKEEEEERQKQHYLELQREFRSKKKMSKKKKKPQKEEEEEYEEEEEEEQYDVAKDIEELYGNVMSAEQLAKLDSQPNPFNFSDRVTQSLRAPKKELAQQTNQPPSTTFGDTVGLSILCDAYDRDYEMKQEAERRRKEREAEEAQKEDDKKTDKKENKEEKKEGSKMEGKAPLMTQSTKTPPDPVVLLPPPPSQGQGGLAHLDRAARVVERIVQQNVYDEVIHDYKYWEDQSDDYRPLEGSLLPLWRLTAPLSRRLFVSDVSWSPTHPDLLAVAYSAGDSGEPPEPGYLCLFSLKNPSVPERCLPCPCGVTCVRFHPTKESVVCAGQEDGAVLVYDARHTPSQPPRLVVTPCTGGKHLMGVCQVAWMATRPGQLLCFLSVGRDGRVTKWTVRLASLEPTDLLQSGNSEASEHQRLNPNSDRAKLQGTVTCVALKAEEPNLLLLGLDSGAVVEMTLTASVHSLFQYPAHAASVRLLAWNGHHGEVFASTSIDWMLKVWARGNRCPLVALDLGAPVAGLTWSHLGASLVLGVTEDGKVHVYDLYLRRCRPLCVQNLMQRRKTGLTCTAFSPFHPVLVVGGERGYLLTLKLSPNLRRPPKEAKGADEAQRKEIEVARLGRIISTATPL